MLHDLEWNNTQKTNSLKCAATSLTWLAENKQYLKPGEKIKEKIQAKLRKFYTLANLLIGAVEGVILRLCQELA